MPRHVTKPPFELTVEVVKREWCVGNLLWRFHTISQLFELFSLLNSLTFLSILLFLLNSFPFSLCSFQITLFDLAWSLILQTFTVWVIANCLWLWFVYRQVGFWSILPSLLCFCLPFHWKSSLVKRMDAKIWFTLNTDGNLLIAPWQGTPHFISLLLFSFSILSSE